LRERSEDLPALCRHLLDGLGFVALQVSSDGIEVLARLPLLGNVRELRGLLASAAVESKLGCIDARVLGAVVAERARLDPPTNPRRASDDELRRMLRHFDGNMARAARHAGVPRSTMRDRVRRDGGGRTTPRPLLASELTDDARALERRRDDGHHPELHRA
jgi:two-component system NtrC family response regulator